MMRRLLGISAAILGFGLVIIFTRDVVAGRFTEALQNYRPTTPYQWIAPWLFYAAYFALTYLSLRFAAKTLRPSRR